MYVCAVSSFKSSSCTCNAACILLLNAVFFGLATIHSRVGPVGAAVCRGRIQEQYWAAVRVSVFWKPFTFSISMTLNGFITI